MMTCRYYGINRQAFHTLQRRYDEHGLKGLKDRSSRPKMSPNATGVDVVGKIVYLRQNYHFGRPNLDVPQRYHDVSISPSRIWRPQTPGDRRRHPGGEG